MQKYKIGDTIQGRVTGIKPYGIFLSIDDSYTGMIHISEITNKYVDSINKYAEYNECLTVKILDINEDSKHMNLSLRALNKGRRINNVYKVSKPTLIIGYKSLEDKLDHWIKEKKND